MKTKLSLRKSQKGCKGKNKCSDDYKLPKFAHARVVDRHNDIFDEAIKEGKELIKAMSVSS
ncbi:MAG: hypothetical protein FH761_13760 [Firmicutes bacterium]|nr:hypothetical protein [Bacillota bacterium]